MDLDPHDAEQIEKAKYDLETMKYMTSMTMMDLANLQALVRLPEAREILDKAPDPMYKRAGLFLLELLAQQAAEEARKPKRKKRG